MDQTAKASSREFCEPVCETNDKPDPDVVCQPVSSGSVEWWASRPTAWQLVLRAAGREAIRLFRFGVFIAVP
jgi:hypothetical protein